MFLAFYAKTRRRSAVIRNNRTYLLENIQPTDKLIASLLSLDCITKEQHHFIQRQRSKRYMNAELLYLMKSFDDTKSSNLLKCLRQSNHGTLARILENGGGLQYLMNLRASNWQNLLFITYDHNKVPSIYDVYKNIGCLTPLPSPHAST